MEAGLDRQRARAPQHPDDVRLRLLTLRGRGLIVAKDPRVRADVNVTRRLGQGRKVIQGHLPLLGPLVDRATGGGSGEGGVRVDALGAQQVQRFEVVDLGDQPSREDRVSSLDRVGHRIFVNAHLVRHVPLETCPGDGQGGLRLLAV